LALGLTLVYSVMNLINFAYGMLLVWTALLAVPLIDSGLPAIAVTPICLVFTTVLSIVMGRAAFRPFLTAPPVTLLITSFGVELVLQYGALLFFGENPRILRVPNFLNEVLFIGGIRVPAVELITIVTAVIVVLGLYALLNRTFFGMQIRAAAEQPDVARLMGISPGLVLTIVFAISGLIAGVVGLLWFAKVGAITPRSDLEPTFKAFISIVLGGLGNTRGAIVGGFTLGGLEVGLSAILPQEAIGYTDAIVFLVVIWILLLRPRGLIGPSVGL
jgi:branched-chain amino acid transport system permease protein